MHTHKQIHGPRHTPAVGDSPPPRATRAGRQASESTKDAHNKTPWGRKAPPRAPLMDHPLIESSCSCSSVFFGVLLNPSGHRHVKPLSRGSVMRAATRRRHNAARLVCSRAGCRAQVVVPSGALVCQDVSCSLQRPFYLKGWPAPAPPHTSPPSHTAKKQKLREPSVPPVAFRLAGPASLSLPLSPSPSLSPSPFLSFILSPSLRD